MEVYLGFSQKPIQGTDQEPRTEVLCKTEAERNKVQPEGWTRRKGLGLGEGSQNQMQSEVSASGTEECKRSNQEEAPSEFNSPELKLKQFIL